MPSEYAQQIGKIAEQVNNLVTTCAEIKDQLDDMNGRQRDDHDKVTELETRLGIWGGAQAGFTAIAATLAAWWGTQR